MDELLIAGPFVNEDTMVMGNMMISGNDMQSSSKEIIVRYAAEDYQCTHNFQVRAYKNSSRKPLWTSQTIEAEGGMDPDLYGRPQFADLNWKLQKFEIPSDLNPDYFSVAFLNDHCCGLSGGDRNFFVDWLAFTGRHYPVAKGKQATRCRDGNETPRSIYCGGNIDFTDFENLVLSEKVTALKSAKDDETSAERMVFQGSSAFR